MTSNPLPQNHRTYATLHHLLDSRNHGCHPQDADLITLNQNKNKMETKFKIGDRVYDKTFGDGTVVHFDSEMYVVDFDEPTDCLNDCNGHSNNGQGLWIRENHLTPIATNSYYYEEVTRNGRQWFRMTPKGEWMPKRDTDNPARTGDGTTMLPTVEQKYDRAGMAAMCLQGILSSRGLQEALNADRTNWEQCAVSHADALIAELEKPKP
jgi:hypothetical protein